MNDVNGDNGGRAEREPRLRVIPPSAPSADEVEAAYMRGVIDGAERERQTYKRPRWRTKKSSHIPAWVWWTIVGMLLLFDLMTFLLVLLDPTVGGGIDIQVGPPSVTPTSPAPTAPPGTSF